MSLLEDPIFIMFLSFIGLFILIAIAIIIYRSYWHFGHKENAQDVAEDLAEIAYKKE